MTGHGLSDTLAPMLRLRTITTALAIALTSLSVAATARAEVPPQRTFFRLPSSNGHGAVMLDLSQARVTHFREHLFATEEPLLDSMGNEVWFGNQPQAVLGRDLLYDAYFGLRAGGQQGWLAALPVDLDKSGYAPWQAGKTGGTGVATMVQTSGSLTLTHYFFSPRALPRAGFVMAIRVQNTGASAAQGVSVFSLHNFHLGYGRTGVMSDASENGETITFDGSGGHNDFLERAFAGVVVARALGSVAHHGASNGASPPAQDVYQIVQNGGTTDLPDLNGQAPTADGSVSAFQFDVGTINAGEERWAGVAFAHHGDPFGGAAVQADLDAYVAGQGAKALVDAEVASWASLQQSINVPSGLSAGEESLFRQSAVMLAMAQVQEDKAYLRPVLTSDNDLRKTRFGTALGSPPASLPATVAHRGKGAVIASLPPGEWTVAWIRDGAYATTALATLGMKDQARDALLFYLNAESGRFQNWSELASYNMPPYLISLVRYYGFGVEETDFNDFGPNLEFDGFGLFLWALRHYEVASGDTTLADQHWATVTTKVADVILALIDPSTGLLRPDSSIWETHWNGRERTWAYTNITAVRGLCDTADIAERKGDMANAQKYRAAGVALRAAIAQKLTDGAGAIASNAEELASGSGYRDAAVLDAIAFGLFDPAGKIAGATFDGIESLRTPAGAGWSRNDDRTDHAGQNDLSPWGSTYDSAEWVVTDLRGAVAARLMGRTDRADALLKWVLDQASLNYLAVAETFDEATGTYKFNAPMVGFGSGAYVLALASRSTPLDAPACGAYFDEGTVTTSSSSGAASGSSSGGLGGAGGSGGSGGGEEGGCGCRLYGEGGEGALPVLFALAALSSLYRRRQRKI